jgi:hypothetical protein
VNRSNKHRFLYRVFLNSGILLLAVSFAFPAFGITDAFAATGVPTIMSYQGRLADSSGNLLGSSSGTTYYFKFSIWDNPTVPSGSKLWPATDPGTASVTVKTGVFNVNIGDTANSYPDALDYNFNTNNAVYLQVEVSSDNSTFQTLTPRQRIASSAFAQLAGAVSGSTTPSSFGTTTPVANSVVTIEATSTNSILATLRARAGQTADLFQVQDSTGANLFKLNSAGTITSSSTATANFDAGINIITSTGGCFAVNGNCLTALNLGATNSWTGGQTFLNATTTGTLAITGNLLEPKGADYPTVGSHDNLDFGTGSLFRYTGNGAATFTGIAGGVDGRQIRIMNASNFSIIFKNLSSSSASGNQINTSSGADLTIPSNVSVTFQYDSGSAKWRVVVLPATAGTLATVAFLPGGNGFGSTATLGTTDAFGLNFVTSGFTRLNLSADSATLTSGIAGAGLSLIASTTGALTLDSGTTGAINIGTGLNGKTLTVGNTTDGTTLNLQSGTGGINLTGLATLDNASTSLLSVSSGLFVNGNATTSPNGNFAINGTLGIAGLSSLTGGLISSASSTFASQLNISGGVAASSTFQSTGATHFYSTAQVDGALTASSTFAATGTTTVYGNFITPRSTPITSIGTVDNLNLGSGSYFHYEGTSDATITGFAGGTDGRLIHIFNDSSNVLTISNLGGTSASANRVATITGQDVTIPQDYTMGLLYDEQSSLWHVVTMPASADTVRSYAYVQSGNAFGVTATFGTTDTNALDIITNGSRRFTVATSSATFAGTGETIFTTDGSALSVIASTTAILTLDSGTTGAINIGTGLNGKIITIGNTTGTTALNLIAGTGGINLTGLATLGNASTTLLSVLNSLFIGTTATSTIVGNNGLSTLKSDLLVTGSTTLQNFTAVNSTTTNATTTNFAVTGNSQLGTVINGTWNGTAIGYAFGGTDQTSYTKGDLLYAVNNNTLARLPIGGSGTVLGVTAGLPAWVAEIGGGSTIAGKWATSTDSLITYPIAPIEAVVVGASATTTLGLSLGAKLEVIGNSLFTGNTTATGLSTFSGGASTTNESISGNFWIGGNATTTSSGAFSTNALISALAAGIGLSVTNNATVGGLLTILNMLGTGSSTIQNLSSENSTSTNATTTNLYATNFVTGNFAPANLSTGGTLTVTGLSTLSNGASTTNISASGAIWTGGLSTTTGGTINTQTNYQIAGTNVLTGTTLGTNVVNSSLTSLGTLTSLTVSGQTSLGHASTTDSFSVAGNLWLAGMATTTNGVTNTQTSFQIAGNNVLTATALGAGIVGSSLTSLGTLTSLTVSGLTTLGQASTTQLSASSALFINGNATTSANGNFATQGTITSGLINGQTISSSANLTGSLTVGSGFTVSAGSVSLPSASVADTALSSNVALLTGTQTFTGVKTFSLPTTFASTTMTASTTISGDFATPKGADYPTTGTQSDINLGIGFLFRYTGNGAAIWRGIAGGVDGRQIRIINDSSNSSDLTLNNQDTGDSVAANRIITADGTNAVVSVNGVISLQYDAGVSRWRVASLPVGTGHFMQGGNAFGATASVGTTDAYAMNFITGGATRFAILSNSATLTGDAATNISLVASTTGSLTLDSATTGGVNLGTGSTAKTITIGNTTGATAVNINTGTAGLTVVGSTTLANFTFLNATGTNATTTTFAVTGFASTSALRVSNNTTMGGTLTVTGAGTFSSTLGVTGLTTLVQASTTRLSVVGTAYFGDTATTTIDGGGLITAQNLLMVGSTTLQNFTFTNATGTNATTTNLAVTGIASTSALVVSNTFSGAGLTTCSATSSKLTWNSTTKQFGCGVDHGAPLAKDNSATASVALSATDAIVLSTAISPSASSVEIRIDATAQINSGSNTDDTVTMTLVKGFVCGTNVLATRTKLISLNATLGVGDGNMSFAIVNSPATTASTTYSMCAKSTGTAHTVTNRGIIVQEVDNIGAADLAEIYPTNDVSLESGDIVSFDPEMGYGVKKSDVSSKGQILGVVSTKPALLIGGTENEGVSGVPVALSGRVPVKVSTENGKIKKGDNLILSSIPGVAMRTTKSGAVIGQAITDFSGDDIGAVMVFVKNSFVAGDTAGMSDGKALLQGLTNGSVTPESSADLSQFTADRIVAGLDVVTPSLTAQTASVGSLSVSENLKVSAPATFASSTQFLDTITASKVTATEFISPGLTMLASTTADIASSTQALLSRVSILEARTMFDPPQMVTLNQGLTVNNLSIMNGGLHVDQIGAIGDSINILNDTNIIGRLYTNSDSGGFAKIPKGGQRVDVTFDREYLEQPVLTTSLTLDAGSATTPDSVFNSQISSIVINKSTKGFTIILNKVATDDITLSWMALAVKSARTSTGNIEVVTPTPADPTPAPVAAEPIAPVVPTEPEQLATSTPTEVVPIEDAPAQDTASTTPIIEPTPTVDAPATTTEEVAIPEVSPAEPDTATTTTEQQ